MSFGSQSLEQRGYFSLVDTVMDEGVVGCILSLSCFNIGKALILALKIVPFAMNDDGDGSDKYDHVDNCQHWFEQRSLTPVPSFPVFTFLTYSFAPSHACLFLPCHYTFLSPTIGEFFSTPSLIFFAMVTSLLLRAAGEGD